MVDGKGNTCLHHAATTQKKHCIELLLQKYSMDTEIKNSDGKTASELTSDSECQKLFDDFFKSQQSKQENLNFIQIQNCKDSNVEKMFTKM